MMFQKAILEQKSSLFAEMQHYMQLVRWMRELLTGHRFI